MPSNYTWPLSETNVKQLVDPSLTFLPRVRNVPLTRRWDTLLFNELSNWVTCVSCCTVLLKLASSRNKVLYGSLMKWSFVYLFFAARAVKQRRCSRGGVLVLHKTKVTKRNKSKKRVFFGCCFLVFVSVSLLSTCFTAVSPTAIHQKHLRFGSLCVYKNELFFYSL